MLSNRTLILLLVVTLCVEMAFGESARKKKKEAKVKGKFHNGCKIRIPEDIPENEPLYLQEQKGVYNIWEPTSKEQIFKTKDELWLFCPGKSNAIANSRLNTTKLTCMETKKFGVANKQISFRTLNCTKEVSGDLRISDRPCANGRGVEYEVGYKFNPKVFLKVFDICYNTSTGSVIYTTHKISGKVIQHIIPDEEHRNFKATGVPKLCHPAETYKKSSQIQFFTEILGEDQEFFNDTYFFTPGQLTPDADFTFSSAQHATYFYANAAPQFQVVNHGNWYSIERLARTMAQKHQTDLLIYTGVFDQLSLTGDTMGRRHLWIEPIEKIEVPKWFWKILINETADSAIVLMTLNNPHAKVAEAQGFCTNICSQVGLISHGLKNLKKGYTYCCELSDFKKTVTFLPETLNYKNVMELSNQSFG